MITRIVVPDVGATGAEMRVVRWLAKEGDRVEAGAPLFRLETDKAVQDIEAFRAGYLRTILAPADTVVEVGAVVALLTDTADESLQETAGTPRSTAPAREQGAPPSRIPASLPLSAPRNPEAPPTRDSLLGLYRRMVLIRRFEDYLYRLFLQGQVPGTLHQCQGQEAVAVGVCAALRPDDVIFSTHRPVGHLLAKGASLPAVAAEIWGKATGCAGGKGGQMHLMDLSVGAYPSNAIVGANIPIATGAALGFRLRGLDRVAVSFFGDGACNTGTFHEGINLASVKDAPVIFVCENNLYAASTHVELAMRVRDIADRAAAYGIPGEVVDGMDVLAVYRAAATALARARAGQGPTLLECKTYRYPGHSRGDPGNYRPREELETWRKRDPIDRCRRLLAQEFHQPEAELDEVEAACQAEVEAAVRFALDSPDPDPAACGEHIYAGKVRE